ncbi:hypothetical protein, partial [Haloferula sp. A504]|uniref:hypothetical protein n=1 Tax=Haloferula sp. A504 TaxID=3373601 RepID=UPI0031CB8EC0|nr:hypothetical protein [Verrucomicrobiaceae bacterium E54]
SFNGARALHAVGTELRTGGILSHAGPEFWHSAQVSRFLASPQFAALSREARSLAPRRIPGPTVPAYHVKNFTGGKYVNRQVSGDEIFYKYHGVNNRTGKTNNYLTNKKHTSEQALRNDLAILDEWGITIDRVTTFKPARGTWISEGTAARQVGDLTGEIRAGGGYQGLIDVPNLPNSTVIKTDLLGW